MEEKYPKPWQVLPAKIIELALEHANINSDFDQQISFLLLDVGVETALKVYLTNKKQDIEKINFYDLLEKTKEFALRDNISLDLNDVLYFHKTRNKLYHQGDGVMPTKDNLERYSKLAPKILKAFINVDLSEPSKESTETTENPLNEQQKYTVTGDFGSFGSIENIDDLAQALKIEFEYFWESCAIITEQLHPSYATRQFAIKYAAILPECPDSGPDTWFDDDPETVLQVAKERVDSQNQRLKKYNELTGKEAKNPDFVDRLLEDIHHLYVFGALKELSSNLNDDWDRYLGIFAKLHIDSPWYPYVTPIVPILERWKRGIDSGQMTTDQVFNEYQEIHVWLESQYQRMDDWVNSHVKGISRKSDPGLLYIEGQ